MTTVAKTSKKPSTHRCTTHQRQYSAIGEIRVPPVAERGPVEQGDGGGGDQEHHQERTLLARLAQRRQNRAHHQRQPEEQPDEQRDLPEPAEVDVLVAAVAEVEPRGAGAEHLLHAQPLAGHRADDDEQERAEQDVDAEALPLRLVAAHRRADEQAGGQPGRGDPEDAELHVPRAGDDVRQELRERDAVERRSPSTP